MGPIMKALLLGASNHQQPQKTQQKTQEKTQGYPYDASTTADPPLRGLEPLSGNGPNTISELASKIIRPFQNKERQSSPTVNTHKPMVPRNDRANFLPVGSRITTPTSQKWCSPASWESKSPQSYPSLKSFKSKDNNNNNKNTWDTSILRPKTGYNFSEAPVKPFSSLHKTHSIDLIDAHFTLTKSKHPKTLREQAIGVRHYGEDVADRNMASDVPGGIKIGDNLPSSDAELEKNPTFDLCWIEKTSLPLVKDRTYSLSERDDYFKNSLHSDNKHKSNLNLSSQLSYPYSHPLRSLLNHKSDVKRPSTSYIHEYSSKKLSTNSPSFQIKQQQQQLKPLSSENNVKNMSKSTRSTDSVHLRSPVSLSFSGQSNVKINEEDNISSKTPSKISRRYTFSESTARSFSNSLNQKDVQNSRPKLPPPVTLFNSDVIGMKKAKLRLNDPTTNTTSSSSSSSYNTCSCPPPPSSSSSSSSCSSVMTTMTTTKIPRKNHKKSDISKRVSSGISLQSKTATLLEDEKNLSSALTEEQRSFINKTNPQDQYIESLNTHQTSYSNQLAKENKNNNHNNDNNDNENNNNDSNTDHNEDIHSSINNSWWSKQINASNDKSSRDLSPTIKNQRPKSHSINDVNGSWPKIKDKISQHSLNFSTSDVHTIPSRHQLMNQSSSTFSLSPSSSYLQHHNNNLSFSPIPSNDRPFTSHSSPGSSIMTHSSPGGSSSSTEDTLPSIPDDDNDDDYTDYNDDAADSPVIGLIRNNQQKLSQRKSIRFSRRSILPPITGKSVNQVSHHGLAVSNLPSMIRKSSSSPSSSSSSPSSSSSSFIDETVAENKFKWDNQDINMNDLHESFLKSFHSIPHSPDFLPSIRALSPILSDVSSDEDLSYPGNTRNFSRRDGEDLLFCDDVFGTNFGGMLPGLLVPSPMVISTSISENSKA